MREQQLHRADRQKSEPAGDWTATGKEKAKAGLGAEQRLPLPAPNPAHGEHETSPNPQHPRGKSELLTPRRASGSGSVQIPAVPILLGPLYPRVEAKGRPRRAPNPPSSPPTGSRGSTHPGEPGAAPQHRAVLTHASGGLHNGPTAPPHPPPGTCPASPPPHPAHCRGSRPARYLR